MGLEEEDKEAAEADRAEAELADAADLADAEDIEASTDEGGDVSKTRRREVSREYS